MCYPDKNKEMKRECCCEGQSIGRNTECSMREKQRTENGVKSSHDLFCKLPFIYLFIALKKINSSDMF